MRMALATVIGKKGGRGCPFIQTNLILGEDIRVRMKHRFQVGALSPSLHVACKTARICHLFVIAPQPLLVGYSAVASISNDLELRTSIQDI